ncbi:hypothetical protein N7444_001977 [Penicillium canescens]|nr:hypothetical protein N7444_001977 [Penicillium canescens]
MTTGRINQVSNVARRLGGQPASRRAVPSAWTPEGAVLYKEGTYETFNRSGTPGVPGDTSDYPIAPTKPLSTGPHAGPTRRPCGRWLAAAYGPRVKGPDPVDNADERRIPRGGSLQESEFQVWSATIDPQTPAVPGT